MPHRPRPARVSPRSPLILTRALPTPANRWLVAAPWQRPPPQPKPGADPATGPGATRSGIVYARCPSRPAHNSRCISTAKLGRPKSKRWSAEEVAAPPRTTPDSDSWLAGCNRRTFLVALASHPLLIFTPRALLHSTIAFWVLSIFCLVVREARASVRSLWGLPS